LDCGDIFFNAVGERADKALLCCFKSTIKFSCRADHLLKIDDRCVRNNEIRYVSLDCRAQYRSDFVRSSRVDVIKAPRIRSDTRRFNSLN